MLAASDSPVAALDPERKYPCPCGQSILGANLVLHRATCLPLQREVRRRLSGREPRQIGTGPAHIVISPLAVYAPDVALGLELGDRLHFSGVGYCSKQQIYANRPALHVGPLEIVVQRCEDAHAGPCQGPAA